MVFFSDARSLAPLQEVTLLLGDARDSLSEERVSHVELLSANILTAVFWGICTCKRRKARRDLSVNKVYFIGI